MCRLRGLCLASCLRSRLLLLWQQLQLKKSLSCLCLTSSGGKGAPALTAPCCPKPPHTACPWMEVLPLCNVKPRNSCSCHQCPSMCIHRASCCSTALHLLLARGTVPVACCQSQLFSLDMEPSPRCDHYLVQTEQTVQAEA